MPFLKRNIFKISMLLLLAASAALCIYAISNYHSNSVTTQNITNTRNFQQGERNQTPETDNQTNITPTQNNTGPRNFQKGGNQSPEMANQAPREQSSDQSVTQQPFNSAGGRMGGGGTSNATKYAPQLIAYAIVFLVLSIAAYYLLIGKKLKVHPGIEKMLILTLLCVGLFLRVSSATLMDGHPFDLNLFRNWATAAANNLFGVYTNSRSIDYPPLYMYVLYLIGKIASITAMSPYFILLLKLPSMVADIATSLIIYKLARKYLSAEISVLLSAFYIFNPAVLINSTFWGQVDSFFTLIVTVAVFLLSEKKTGPAAALFTAAVLMKPQGIIFLPVLFFDLVRQRNVKQFVTAVVFALSTAVVIVLPFSLHQGGLWIFKLFSNTLAEYPYASVNAFNFFGLLGANYAKDTSTLFLLSYHSWGMIFIVMITAFSWLVYLKGNSRVFAAAASLIQIAGVFAFSTRIHERYLFPAVALSILAFIYLKDKRLLLLAAGFSATVYANTHYILYLTGSGVNRVAYNPVLIITSMLNVLLFGYLVKVIYDITIRKKTCTFPCEELQTPN